MEAEYFTEPLVQFALVLGALMAIALVIAAALLAVIWRRLRRLEVPTEANFVETMRAIPLSLAITLDLLDFGLDVLAAPLVWVVLDRLGLKALRDRAALEALIPFTQALPVFSFAWVFLRWTEEPSR